MTGARQPAVPPDVVSAFDYERHAKARLPADVWAYFAGTGADGITARWNREAFDRLPLTGRVLADMSAASTAGTLFGKPLACPVILAPVAFQKLAHPDGEMATVLGASACSAWMTVSTHASCTIEEIAAAAQTTLWFQLYMQIEREDTLRLIRRAEESGYAALMVTVDASVNGVRNVEQRAGFRLPPGIEPVNVRGIAGPTSDAGPGESPVFAGLLKGAPTWRDLEWLRSSTSLPILAKGILAPDDAERSVAAGVDGIIVSNHGGRTLDTLPASIDALRRVSRRVNGRVPLLVDGGIRRGTDILKCLALGAQACLIGQPLVHALAVAGAVGIVHLLTILRAELEVAMALTGCATLADVDESVLWPQADAP